MPWSQTLQRPSISWAGSLQLSSRQRCCYNDCGKPALDGMTSPSCRPRDMGAMTIRNSCPCGEADSTLSLSKRCPHHIHSTSRLMYASESAYTGIVYIQMVDAQDVVHVSLVMAKTKVAPLKRACSDSPQLYHHNAYSIYNLYNYIKQTVCVCVCSLCMATVIKQSRPNLLC